MTGLERRRELAKLTKPQLIDRIVELEAGAGYEIRIDVHDQSFRWLRVECERCGNRREWRLGNLTVRLVHVCKGRK